MLQHATYMTVPGPSWCVSWRLPWSPFTNHGSASKWFWIFNSGCSSHWISIYLLYLVLATC